MSQYIEVRKLSPIYEESKLVKDPSTNKLVRAQVLGYNSFIEVIRINQIKSFKEYGKRGPQKTFIVGDVTLIYFMSDASKKPVEMMIEENFRDFSKRLGAIQLPDED